MAEYGQTSFALIKLGIVLDDRRVTIGVEEHGKDVTANSRRVLTGRLNSWHWSLDGKTRSFVGALVAIRAFRKGGLEPVRLVVELAMRCHLARTG